MVHHCVTYSEYRDIYENDVPWEGIKGCRKMSILNAFEIEDRERVQQIYCFRGRPLMICGGGSGGN